VTTSVKVLRLRYSDTKTLTGRALADRATTSKLPYRLKTIKVSTSIVVQFKNVKIFDLIKQFTLHRLEHNNIFYIFYSF